MDATVGINVEKINGVAGKIGELIELYYGPMYQVIGLMGEIKFYEYGEARDIFDGSAYKEALAKLMDVADLYARAAQFLIYTRDNMIAMDDAHAAAIRKSMIDPKTMPYYAMALND